MKKQRELTMILGVIVLVFVLNFFVFRLAYLQEQIFLTHAYAFTAEESSHVGFYYITNADEKRQPLEITCPELGEDEIFEVIDTEQWQGHGMYTWNEMWVDFDVPDRVGDLSNVILTLRCRSSGLTGQKRLWTSERYVFWRRRKNRFCHGQGWAQGIQMLLIPWRYRKI